uniref:DNA-directed RNA polymerase n=1 Tax=Chlamydomonas nivalis TaxID=47906 RepID=A0A0S2IBA8_9CHLO|nr:alpha subunit of RNA polymerase [Chlamydomonas nivalis]
MIKFVKNDFFIYCKEARIESHRSFYGSFSLGPFEAGQSITIANALRRTLLSELKGLAITSAEIEGAFHEYATLPGVRDSILDILLNLKDIVLKSINYGNKKKGTSYTATFKNEQRGYLKSRGPGIVTASDLKLPPGIQCVDPDQYIATLSEEGILNIKFNINEGASAYGTHESSSFNKQKASAVGGTWDPSAASIEGSFGGQQQASSKGLEQEAPFLFENGKGGQSPYYGFTASVTPPLLPAYVAGQNLPSVFPTVPVDRKTSKKALLIKANQVPPKYASHTKDGLTKTLNKLFFSPRPSLLSSNFRSASLKTLAMHPSTSTFVAFGYQARMGNKINPWVNLKVLRTLEVKGTGVSLFSPPSLLRFLRKGGRTPYYLLSFPSLLRFRKKGGTGSSYGPRDGMRWDKEQTQQKKKGLWPWLSQPSLCSFPSYAPSYAYRIYTPASFQQREMGKDQRHEVKRIGATKREGKQATLEQKKISFSTQSFGSIKRLWLKKIKAIQASYVHKINRKKNAFSLNKINKTVLKELGYLIKKKNSDLKNKIPYNEAIIALSTPLVIDPVFMPVNKVNYIIEINEQSVIAKDSLGNVNNNIGNNPINFPFQVISKINKIHQVSFPFSKANRATLRPFPLPPPTNFSYTNPMDAFGGKDVKQSTGSRGPSPIHLWCMPLAYTNLLTHQSIKHAINPGSLKLRLNKYASNSIINNTFFSIKKKQAWQIEPKTLLKKSHIVFFKASFLRTFSTNYAFNLSKLTNQIPFWRSKYRIKTGVLKNKNENKKKFLKPSKFGTASLIMLGAPTPSTKGVSVTKVSSSSRTSNLSSAWSCLFHSHPLFSSKDSKLRLEKATVSYTNRKTSSNSIVFFKPFIALRSAVWPLSISATKINYMIALKKFSYFYGAPKTFKQSLKLFNVIEKSLYGATIALANLRLHSFHVHQRWKGEGPLHQRWKRSSVRLPMDRGLYLQHSSYSSSFPPTLRTHPPKVELVDVLLRKRAGDGWEKNATAPNLEDKNKLLGPNFYIRGPKKTNRKFSRGTLLSNYPQIKFPLSGIQTSLKNNIILEIWTNGSIHPRQALYDACKNLLSIFSKLEKARFTRAIFQSEKTYEKLGFSLISSETTAMAQNPQPWWKSNLIKQSLIKNEWQTSNGSLPFSVVNKLNQTRFLRLWGKTYNNNTYSHSQKMLPSNPLNKRISLGTKQCYAYTSTKGVLRRGVWDGVGECYAPIHPKTKGRVPSTREVNSYSSTPLEIAGYPNVFNKKNTNKEMAFKHNSTVHPSYAHQRWMEGAPTSSIPLTSKVRIKGIFHMPFLKGLRSNPFLTLKLPIPFLATAALIKGVDPKQEEGSSRRKERAEPLINESKFSFVPIWGVMFNKNKQFFLAMPKNHQIAFFQNQTRKKNFLMQSIAIKGCYKNGFYLSKLANTKANAKASFTPVSLNNLAVNTSKSTNALKANQVPLWLEAKMNQVLGASYGAPEKGPLIIENLKKIDVFLKQKQINWNIKMSLTDYNLLKTKPDFVDIGKLNISLRPYTCLKRANINTLGELLKKSKEELLALKNFGKQSLKELEENLKQLGLSLRS